jgi:GntR family colanic acid and biofilm gene transcriptional regulator
VLPVVPYNFPRRVAPLLPTALWAGELTPAQRLAISDLARQLGTSATPVREAVLRLAAVRGLELRRGHSVCVPQLSRNRYVELCDIRLLTEGHAAERAAANVTGDTIEELTQCFAQYRSAQAAEDVAATLHHNQRFRFVLYEAAAMPTLLGMIEDLWLQVGPLFNLLYPRQPSDPPYEQHFAEVIGGLRDRDGPAVRHAVEAAIRAGSVRLLTTWPAEDVAQSSSRRRTAPRAI